MTTTAVPLRPVDFRPLHAEVAPTVLMLGSPADAGRAS